MSFHRILLNCIDLSERFRFNWNLVQFLLDARQRDPPSNTNKSIGFLFKNEILLELSSSSFGTISHPGSDEIG
ncbi:hypothetical protein RIF29_43255 [Crotalaria pallida]|uniref:Uncharacterized protein n=1 Tax=Crotalaria pallida TaxID=3830 RepID=A0AAN9DZ30_CROPI